MLTSLRLRMTRQEIELLKTFITKPATTVLSLVLLFAATTAMGQARFVHTQGKALVGPDGSKLLLRGTNLGNWFEPEGYMFQFEKGPASPREIEAFVNEMIGPAQAEQFWHIYRDAYVTEDDVRLLHQAGFNSVRVPLHYKFFTAGNDEGFRLLDRLIGWSRKYGIYLILDLHCAPGGQTGTNIDDSWGWPWLYDSPADQEETIAIWKRIAEHYRDEPAVLGYDLLNEPIPHFPQLRQYNSALEPIYKRVTAAIRTVDPNHVIILGGAQWDSNFDIFGPPSDKNVIYTFHKYWTPPTEAVIASYVAFRDRYKVPIWLGESGENTDDWIRQFVTVLEKEDIGWAFWPYKKMERPSAVVSFSQPVYWDEMVKYAQERTGTGNAEKQIAERPSLEHSRAAFDDLLRKIRLAQCRVNGGYLQALGLKTPAS